MTSDDEMLFFGCLEPALELMGVRWMELQVLNSVQREGR